MSKTLLAESFGQRLLVICTALSPFYVEKPHVKGSALYKYPTNRCKNHLERSTDPNVVINLVAKLAIKNQLFLLVRFV
jgi:hypothetical protein